MTGLKLISLDITNNPDLVVDNHLLDALFSVNTLEHLNIDANEN